MRDARILMPILAALAAAGCMQHSPDEVAGRGVFTGSVSSSTYVQEAEAPPLQPPSILQYRAKPKPPLQKVARQYPPPPPPRAEAQEIVRPYPAPPPPVVAPVEYAYAPAAVEQPYRLDSGDKLRIVVFGQEGISSSYLVDASGNVNVPLVGSVPARGHTTQQLTHMIADRLKQGYVRDPHVSVEVEAYRPFFILGEVTTPGQYPYVANMTVEKAVAIAGGFSPRAYKYRVEVSRTERSMQVHEDVPLDYPLHPGDTITVKERWF